MRCALFRTCLVVMVLLLANACGKVAASKDQQAQAFYDEKLHTNDEKKCNAEGWWYANSQAVCETGRVQLATWPCNRAGLEAQLNKGQSTSSNKDSDAPSLAQLDQMLQSGWEIHSCGEDLNGGINLVIIKKNRTSDEATLEIGLLRFAPARRPQLRFADRKSMGSTGDCQSINLEQVGTIGTGGDAFFGQIAAKSDITIDVSTKPLSNMQLFYSDSACVNKAETVVMKAGQSTVSIYFKFTTAQKVKIHVAADGFDKVDDADIGAVGGDTSVKTTVGGDTSVKTTVGGDAGDIATVAEAAVVPSPDGGDSKTLRFMQQLSAPGSAGDCQTATIELVAGDSKSQVEATTDLAILVETLQLSTTDNLTLYTDASCSTSGKKVTLKKGAKTVSIYYKFGSAGTSSLYATCDGFPGFSGDTIQAL